MNRDRTLFRRRPQRIQSVTPDFNENDFNFNKANQNEYLLYVNYKNIKFLFLINNSPLTNYHTLICPDVDKNQPQVLTREAIEFAIKYLQSLEKRYISLIF